MYLRCPLCTQRAGILKATILSSKTKIFEHLNPDYHKYLQSFTKDYPESPIQSNSTQMQDESKEESELKKDDVLIKKAQQILAEDIFNESSEEENETYKQSLYYDFHNLQPTYSEEELKNEPKPRQVWIHLTCALFISELYFQDKSSLSQIAGEYTTLFRSVKIFIGFENIHSDRFYHECSACGKTSKLKYLYDFQLKFNKLRRRSDSSL